MMSSLPMSSEISVANGIPLIETPRIESGSAPVFSLSSKMMSVSAAARKPIRFPYTPIERQPIFTSFGGAPPPTPRERSHVTVSGERWSSSPISLSLSPFSFNSMAFFTRASRLFTDPPGARIGLRVLRLLPRADGRLEPLPSEAAQPAHLVLEQEPHVLRREGAGVQERVVEELVRVRVAHRALHVRAEPLDQVLADEVRELVRRGVRIPLHLREGAGALHPRLPDEQVDRVVERHPAAVKVHVDEDAAGPPNLVPDLHELRPGVGREPRGLHHVLAVVGPPLDRLRRGDEGAREGRVRVRAHELEVVSRIPLVDRGVAGPRVVVVTSHLRLGVALR